MKEDVWYKSWFDSPYYHLLYSHRDEREAEYFIGNLTKYLNLKSGANILDMPCGSGRHALILRQLGFRVTGADLSPSNIQLAKDQEAEGLEFFVHDMREPLKAEAFDCVLNLFTSIGYFDDEEENIRTFRSLAVSCKSGGTVVIDFMNTAKVISELVPEETKTIEGIDFHISRYLSEGYICKSIQVRDSRETFHFMEKVKAWNREDFQKYFIFAGLEQRTILGNYQLDAFDPINSPRMIFILSRS